MKNIKTENGQLSYFKYGSGSKALLTFHGFGQDHSTFREWSEIIGEKYTLYAFDLFYHGGSTRSHKKLSKEEWRQYLSAFLVKEKIDRFSVLGFSLGGRFAIASSLAFPQKIEELILIAPDGIYLTIWFKLATHLATRWLFKYVMLTPNKLDTFIAITEKYRITTPYLGDFLRKEMGDAPNRKRVYISWNCFKSLGYSKKQLARLFKQHAFKRRIILGSKDHIIKSANILPVIKKMGGFQVDTLPLKHHQLIKPEVAVMVDGM